ncbi:hypothetical protein K438DRAFT_1782294 [Mycena galopus ATCC 62051]|nr:hypothetical protein K438DRAFT_1782294 [Mycena galopus ATCC 62051]
MPAPAEVAGSATTIPRPTGAQLAVKSCDCIPRKDRDLLKARVKTLVSEMLNIAVPYTQQLPGNLEKIETKVLITARLKHFASQKVTKAAKKIIEAAEAATSMSAKNRLMAVTARALPLPPLFVLYLGPPPPTRRFTPGGRLVHGISNRTLIAVAGVDRRRLDSLRDEIACLKERLIHAHRRRRDAETCCQEIINQSSAACAQSLEASPHEHAAYWREHHREAYETVLGQLTEHMQRLEGAHAKIAGQEQIEAAMREQFQAAAAEFAEQNRRLPMGLSSLDRPKLKANSALAALNKAHEEENASSSHSCSAGKPTEHCHRFWFFTSPLDVSRLTPPLLFTDLPSALLEGFQNDNAVPLTECSDSPSRRLEELRNNNNARTRSPNPRRLKPVRAVRLERGEDDEVIYFYPSCDPCPICCAAHKRDEPPSYHADLERGLRVPITPAFVPYPTICVIFPCVSMRREDAFKRRAPLPIKRRLTPAETMKKRYTCTCSLRDNPHLVTFADKIAHEKELAEKVAREKELDRILNKAANDLGGLSLDGGHSRSVFGKCGKRRSLWCISLQYRQFEQADLLAALTLTDSGPDIAQQPSKLWTPRSQFQDIRAPCHPVSFAPLGLEEVNCSVQAIVANPPQRVDKVATRRQNIQDELKKQLSDTQKDLDMSESFDVGNAGHLVEMHSKLGSALQTSISVEKSLNPMPDSPQKANLVAQLRVLEIKINFVGSVLPPETTPLPYDTSQIFVNPVKGVGLVATW